jgi:hypothetical protein
MSEFNRGGDIVFESLWRVYRVGEEYRIWHDNTYFATTNSLPKANRIINAIVKLGGE